MVVTTEPHADGRVGLFQIRVISFRDECPPRSLRVCPSAQADPVLCHIPTNGYDRMRSHRTLTEDLQSNLGWKNRRTTGARVSPQLEVRRLPCRVAVWMWSTL